MYFIKLTQILQQSLKIVKGEVKYEKFKSCNKKDYLLNYRF